LKYKQDDILDKDEMMDNVQEGNNWKEVSVSIIVKTFLRCCMSIAVDGMRDDILFGMTVNKVVAEGPMDELSH
jgi:hypothetical protein